jgi:hypothetical protein
MRMNLKSRIWIILLFLVAEGVAVSLCIRGVPIAQASTQVAAVVQAIHAIQGWLFRFLIAYVGSIAILILPAHRDRFAMFASVAVVPVRKRWLIFHATLLMLLLMSSVFIDVAALSPELLVLAALARPVFAICAGLALCAANTGSSDDVRLLVVIMQDLRESAASVRHRKYSDKLVVLRDDRGPGAIISHQTCHLRHRRRGWHDAGLFDVGIANLQFPLIRAIEARSQDQIDIPVCQDSNNSSVGRDRQMSKAVFAHDLVRVFQRCVDVNRVGKWRHECNDLWIVFHSDITLAIFIIMHHRETYLAAGAV